MFCHLISLAIAAAALSTAVADETKTVQVQFEAGKSQAVLKGKVTGRDSVVYKLNARDKQFLKVSFKTKSLAADYNIYIPGRGPGDEALFTSAMGGHDYVGQLYKTGDHTISVFLNRAAARRGESAEYELTVGVTDQAPPAAPAKPVDAKLDAAAKDGIEAVKKQVGHDRVSLISVREGENGIIVLLKVDGAQKPWRAYHDGKKVTSVEYTDEG